MQQKVKEERHNGFVKAFFHLAFWLVFISFIFDFSGLYRSFQGLFILRDTNTVDEAFIFLPLAIGLFYWNYSYLINKYFNKAKWVRYCVGVLLSYLLTCLFSDGLYHLLERQGYDFNLSNKRFMDDCVQLYLITIVASISLGIAKTAIINSSKKREAEKKQKEAELKYLANQFNPHFLHNTLNGIYSIAIEENAPETTEAILRLSEIMRYPIKQGLKREVPLKEEVAFIEDYIALQKLRLGDDYPIQFEKDNALDGVKILPLSLIILVENALKYGVSQKDKTPIFFQLKLTENHLSFMTKNQVKDYKTESSHKIGLQNLKTRLHLLYNDKYSLQTEVKEDKYVVVLQLEMN